MRLVGHSNGRIIRSAKNASYITAKLAFGSTLYYLRGWQRTKVLKDTRPTDRPCARWPYTNTIRSIGNRHPPSNSLDIPFPSRPPLRHGIERGAFSYARTRARGDHNGKSDL